jgi:hypothetical protein
MPGARSALTFSSRMLRRWHRRRRGRLARTGVKGKTTIRLPLPSKATRRGVKANGSVSSPRTRSGRRRRAMQEGPEPLYDLQQLAAIAPFNQRQLRRYIKSGRLVAGKLGEGRSAKWVVRAGDWETFVEESFRAQSQLPDAGVQPRGARAATKTACRVVRRARAPKRARGAPPPLGSLESLRARSGLASACSSAAAAHDAPQSPSHVHLDRAAGEQLRCQVGDGPGRPLRLQPGKKGAKAGARPSVDQMTSSAARSESPT